MVKVPYVYWEDEGHYLGHLEAYPDYVTQGESLDDLKEHLADLYRELDGGLIPGVKHRDELIIS